MRRDTFSVQRKLSNQQEHVLKIRVLIDFIFIDRSAPSPVVHKPGHKPGLLGYP